MQEQTKPIAGKLDNIKAVTAIVPDVKKLRTRCYDARVQLDEMLANLRTYVRESTAAREEAARRELKREEYKELIKQREDERRAAEAKIDEKAEALRVKQQTARQEKEKQQAQPQPQKQTQQSPQPQKGQASAGLEKRSGRDERSAQQRPGAQFQRPQYQGSRPFDGKTQRTWTPSQSTNQGGRSVTMANNKFGSPRGDRPPFGQRPGYQGGAGQGQRPFAPRPAGATGPRPFGPRPAGAVGGARPGVTARPTERFIPKSNTYSDNKKKKGYEGDEKSGIDRRSLLRRGIIEEQEIEERMLTRIFKTKKAKENASKAPKEQSNVVVINTNNLTVKTLSEKIGRTVPEIIKQLMVLGSMCTINSIVNFELAELVALEFGFKLELHAGKSFEEKMSDVHKTAADEGKLEARPPVVTVMGHVDHGKTSLLDAIRKTNVASRESGGITQHIGAYMVTHAGKKITFLDTPGHAAFDKMRARGAKITDIAVLTVAADDGVMPQTIEAIKHIQREKLPMIVAVNKIDKKEANIDRVKQQLSEHNVISEEWGGDAILVPVSAVTGKGLDKLLENILMVAEVYNYRANPSKEAQGAIIEAKLDKNRGPMVTILVQSGTLKVGDTLLAGTTSGKVRGMTDENGKAMKRALPGTPVSVLGFNEVPKAGDAVYVVDAQLTKQVVLERKSKEKTAKVQTRTAGGIDVLATMTEADKKQLNVILKGDVAGSVEAIIQSIKNITSDEVNVNVISHGVGVVNDNDVNLAEMTGALLVSFNNKTSPSAKTLAEKLKVKIHNYKVIYEIFDYITDRMVRMFSPKFTEKYFGKAEVRAVFKSSQIGLIAGCMVLDGKIMRNAKVKLLRADAEIARYNIESLKIKTTDTKEVAQNFECGIKLDGGATPAVGDILECFGMEPLPIIHNGKRYEF